MFSHGVDMSASSITYIILALLIVVLVFVTQCQRSEIRSQKAEIEQTEARIESLQAQLEETIAQRDADRRRIIETARRLDEALTLFVNNSEEAHHEHEERMESLAEIESPEAVDWLCKPVPDDIRMLLGCGPAAGGSDRCEARTTNGIDAALQ